MLLLREMPSQEPTELLRLYRERHSRGAMISAGATRSEYPVHPDFRPEWGCLAVAAVRNGREEYRFGDRTLVVDDDVYLVLGPASRYSYRLRCRAQARCLTVSFPPSMVASVAGSVGGDGATALELREDPDDDTLPPVEHLAQHDRFVTPELRRLERATLDGVVDPEWYSQQAAVLLSRILGTIDRESGKLGTFAASKSSTRRELARRVARATDRIHQDYRRALDLRSLAATAELSPFYLLRLFKQVHGITPQEFLQRKRARVARRLLGGGRLSTATVARLVGFRSRSSLRRWMRRDGEAAGT